MGVWILGWVDARASGPVGEQMDGFTNVCGELVLMCLCAQPFVCTLIEANLVTRAFETYSTRVLVSVYSVSHVCVINCDCLYIYHNVCVL